MRVYFSTRYDRDYRKLEKKMKSQVDERILLFIENQFHPLLNNHTLGGEYEGCRSINITGDYRAIFEPRGEVCIFIRVGTHSELYGK